MRLLAVFGLLVTTMLAGCDFEGGLKRYAKFQGQLTVNCVRRGLEAAEGVSHVRYRQPESCNDYHRFDYRVADLDTYLQFEQGLGGMLRYWNEYSLLNSVPPQEEVDRIRPHLSRIDASVGHACGIENLPERVSERCYRVECN